VRALVLTGHGSPGDVLDVQDRPAPEPGAGQVRIAVRAAGLNWADLVARRGLYPDAPAPPAVLGYEVAGEVESAGEGVIGLDPGRRVFAATRFGGFAELAVADAANVVPMPDGTGFENAAAIPVNYVTAYATAVFLPHTRRGETVLVHAAAGGVGIATLQLLRDIGAVAIGTASGSKHQALRANGATHAIDYRTQDTGAEVKRITSGRGVDVVLDGLGEFRESFDLLAPGGRLVAHGASNVIGGGREGLRERIRAKAVFPELDALRLMNENKAVIGFNMMRHWEARGSLAELLQPLRDPIERGVIEPVVAATFPLEEAAAAHELLESRRNVGKVVLVL
jgi:NADPH:quinone reductase-like Zn-dependent oxidoreductase